MTQLTPSTHLPVQGDPSELPKMPWGRGWDSGDSRCHSPAADSLWLNIGITGHGSVGRVQRDPSHQRGSSPTSPALPFICLP